MQNSSRKSTPRPLIYRNKAELQQFVMGNASQSYSLNIPIDPSRTVPQFLPNTTMPSSSLFDRYHRNSLLLRDCDRRDITVLHKNLVLSQQPLSAYQFFHFRELVQEVAQKAGCKVQMAATGALFPRDPQSDAFLRTAPDPSFRTTFEPSLRTAPVVSRQFQQNEVLFNYGGMAQAKRERKQQFLSEIEARIAEAEREIADLQELQEEERAEMGEFVRSQRTVGEQLSRNVELGNIRQKVGQALGLEEVGRPQPARIHQEMEPRQINELLEEHIRANEDILERARSIGKGEEKRCMEKAGTTSSFNHTMGKMGRPQKSLGSTMKPNNPPRSKVK